MRSSPVVAWREIDVTAVERRAVIAVGVHADAVRAGVEHGPGGRGVERRERVVAQHLAVVGVRADPRVARHEVHVAAIEHGVFEALGDVANAVGGRRVGSSTTRRRRTLPACRTAAPRRGSPSRCSQARNTRKCRRTRCLCSHRDRCQHHALRRRRSATTPPG